MRRSLHHLGLVAHHPLEKRQRFAGKEALVGIRILARLEAPCAPFFHDAGCPLVGRENGIANRLSCCIDEEKPVAIAGEPDDADVVDGYPRLCDATPDQASDC